MNIETLASLVDKKIDLSDGGLKDFRSTHSALFKKNGFKEKEPDSYKFTNLTSFFEGMSYNPKLREVEPQLYKGSFPTITLIDGEFSKTDNLPDGITIKKMRDHFHDIKGLFTEANSLSHLHHALFSEGLIIEVEKKMEISTPVRILNIMTKSALVAPTHMVVTHPFSKITFIEETHGFDDSYSTVSETYLLAHPGSHIEHIVIQQEGKEALDHGSVFAEVQQDATVKSFVFHVSGKLNRKNLVMNLNAPGSNGESYCLFLTHGNEHSDINTVINHRAADTTSTQIAKGILDGESKGIFTGKIHIFPQAQRVASSQLNKNLLLSKKAQVHSQPQLEIFADDVKCSHGSTTGQLSADEVFYFQARGIPEEKARTILAHGFGLEVVQKIGNIEARDHISSIVLESLVQKFNLGSLI